MTIAEMYRPNLGYPTDGPTTVWSQQRARLQELALENGDGSEIDPRERCLTDFQKWVDEHTGSGERVVVLTDANQAVSEKTTKYSLCDLVVDCRLRSVMEDAYPGQSLRSLDQGSKTIDHILTTGINCAQVRQVGNFPFGLGFSSDHRAVFADLKIEEILNLCMEEPAHREGRWLSSKNNK